MKQIIYLISIILLFATCKKKELPLPTPGNPIFHFDGIIGNDTVFLQAGVNGIYHYTDFFKDDQNLTTVRGYFAPDSCTNCEPFLSFEAKDKAQTSTLTLSQSIALVFGKQIFTSYSLDSLTSSTITEKFSFFTDIVNTSNYQYLWDFGDGDTSSLANPTHIYAQPAGIRNVKLKVTTNNISDSIANAIDANYGSTCRAQFNYNLDTISNSIIVDATTGFSYSWNFGNGLTSSFQIDSTTFNNIGVFNIVLTASKTGCTSTFTKRIRIPLNQTLPTANFSYSVINDSVTQNTARLNSSAFIITWKKNGQTYYSYKNEKGINQSDKPIFTLTGFSLYNKNEKGNSTVKVTGNVDTYLYNSQNANDSIKIKTNSLTFAVAHPD